MKYFELVRLPVAHCFLTAVFLLCSGCVSDRPAPPAAYVYVVDYSGSTGDVRRRQLGEMLAELESAPEDSSVFVYRMGFDTQEIYSGAMGDSSLDSIAATVNEDVTTSDPKKGTNFAKMAEALVSFARRFSGKRFLVRILTDGGDDFKADLESCKRYQKAADLVCRDARLSSLTFFGVKPGFREDIRRIWSNAGGRLEILGRTQSLGD